MAVESTVARNAQLQGSAVTTWRFVLSVDLAVRFQVVLNLNFETAVQQH